jgi:excisionase family DNA binding protein
MELLTPKEVKAILKCSLPYVYKMAERGLLPCVRIPNIDNPNRASVRFKKEDIFRFIDDHYTGQTA